MKSKAPRHEKLLGRIRTAKFYALGGAYWSNLLKEFWILKNQHLGSNWEITPVNFPSFFKPVAFEGKSIVIGAYKQVHNPHEKPIEKSSLIFNPKNQFNLAWKGPKVPCRTVTSLVSVGELFSRRTEKKIYGSVESKIFGDPLGDGGPHVGLGFDGITIPKKKKNRLRGKVLAKDAPRTFEITFGVPHLVVW